MRQKWTIEKARGVFGGEGFKLLSNIYKSIVIKLDCICPKGHTCSISLGNFLNGTRCRTCSNKKIGDRKRVDPTLIRRAFESEGYTLLSEYKSNRQKLEFICPQGHTHTITWTKWKQGRRCGKCYDLLYR